MRPCLPGEIFMPMRVSVVHHNAVATDVDPIFVRIACDHDVAGADIAPAVALVPKRHRKLEEIDIVAGKNIFQHRSARDGHRRNRRRLRQTLAPRLNESFARDVQRQIGRERRAFQTLEEADENAISRRVVFDPVEEQRRAVFFVLRREHRQRADLQIPIRALDDL